MSINKIYCSCCDKKIRENERFIVGKHNQIYCTECAEEDSITIYTVMGEIVGDETNTEEYSSIEKFKKSLEDEIKEWEKHLIRYENINGEKAEQRREVYRSKIRLAKNRYKKYFE